VSQYEFMGVDFDFSGLIGVEPKVKSEIESKIREAVLNELRDGVKRMTLEPIKPLTEEQRKVPGDVTDFHQYVSNFNFSSFSYTYSEEDSLEWPFTIQGTVEPIVTMSGKDGKPLKWEDFASTVDLDDPFFKTLEVPVRVNADFADLGIDTVEVHLDYHSGPVHQIKEFSFKDVNTLEKFKSFIDADNWTYRYWYEVNYKGQSKSFKTKEFETDEKFLTINVGDTGILSVNAQVGDIDWAVKRAQVTLRYDGPEGKIERQISLDKEHTNVPIRVVLFSVIDQPYSYQVRYEMNDGKTYEVSEAKSRAPILTINDPFGTTKTIGLRGLGNFEKDIQTVFLDLLYDDARNKYSRTQTVALSKSTPFFDWSFPAIDERSGEVTYSGKIVFQNGQVEDIPETKTSESTLFVGKKIEDELKVSVMVSKRIDFAKVDLVQVSLRYVDAANHIDEREDLNFEAKDTKAWVVQLRDKSKKSYKFKVTFFMADGSKKVVPEVEQDDETIVLQMPA
jgi:hypothetical protein